MIFRRAAATVAANAVSGVARWARNCAACSRARFLFALVGFSASLFLISPGAALAQDETGGPEKPPTEVGTEKEFRAAWANPRETSIRLTDDIYLHQCKTGDPIRESAFPMMLDGDGHTMRQTCFEKRVLRQDGTGYLLIKDIRLTRGGADGPGAALTSRGEIEITGSKIQQNLSEEPGGGVFSMRRITARDSIITNNLANDDGGGLYARRGGVQVYDSIVSNNLVGWIRRLDRLDRRHTARELPLRRQHHRRRRRRPLHR